MLPKSLGKKGNPGDKSVSAAMSRWSIDEGMKKKIQDWEKGSTPEKEEIEEEAKQEVEKQRLESQQMAERQRAAQRLKENIERVRAYKERQKMRKKKAKTMAGVAGKLSWNIFGFSNRSEVSQVQRMRIRKQEGGSSFKA
jgi:hypothetical protein